MLKYGLIGESLNYSYSKIIHEYLASELNIEMTYDLVEVDDLSELNLEMYDGLNVTVPYKTEIMDMLTYIDDNAMALGSVNTVDFNLKGYNTDIVGFLYLVDKLNLESFETIVVLGSGAMAKMIKNYYHDKKVIIISRTDSVYNYDNLDKISGDILINATPVSMGNSYMDLLVDEEFITKFSGVIDLNYNPQINHFLNLAARNFIPYTNGLDMLLIQAMKAFEIFNDVIINRDLFISLRKYVLSLTTPKKALIGFSYSGKSTFILENMGYDLDLEIEKVVGMPIDIFIEVMGIEEFRRIEKNTLNDLAANGKSPIALGAGAVLDFDNQLLLHDYQILDMTESMDVIKSRYKNDGSRPLLKSIEDVEKLYNERLKYYNAFKTSNFEYGDLT